jgi:ABC-type bacteriocin/lantibiotic exporter with double-glycine peptidase domain
VKKNQTLPITQQHDQSDCGVACLQSLLQYYGGQASLEELRSKSGTTKQGTTLLGLYQAANQLGFVAQGCEADAHALIEHGAPVVLHITTEKGLQHYVVCYAAQPNQFTIADPASGQIETWDEKKLLERWQSKTCLTLKPVNVVQTSDVENAKRTWLKNLITPDVPLLAIASAIGLGMSVLGMVMSVFSQQLIDVILPNKQSQKLITGIALVAALLLARVFFQRLRQTLLVRQTRDFNNRVINAFYSALLHLPKSFFDTRKIGELVARLNDTGRIQRVISLTAGSAVIDMLLTLTSLLFIYVYYWPAGVVATLSLPLLFLLVYRYNKPISTAQKDVMAGYAQSESYFMNSMQGIAAVKQLNREADFVATNKKVYGAYQEKIVGLGMLNVKLGFSAGLASVLFLVALLVLTSYHVLQEKLLLGEMMAVLGISSSLIPSVTNLALLSVPINEAKVAFNRMFEFLSIDPENHEGEALEEIHEIELKGVSFRYPGRKPLFAQLNLVAKRGDVVLITGGNGSGKTTLLQLLQKFYVPESGRITVNQSHDLQAVSTAALRQHIGAIDQEIPIFNGTLAENLLIAQANRNPTELDAFLEKSGFNRFFQNFPNGYATLLGEEGINLSGGQKQLIGLCRALMREPQILILDEPETALDGDVWAFLIQKIEAIKPHALVFICTHEPDKYSKLANFQLSI